MSETADDPLLKHGASMASIVREMAYAASKFVATDDGYWREQLDYLEGQLRAEIVGERPAPITAEEVAREVNRRKRKQQRTDR